MGNSSISRCAWIVALCLAIPLVGFAEQPLREVIDAELRAAWQREKIEPAPQAGDAVFLRRIHLDLAGIIPTADEAAAFLNDTDSSKRAKLIDKLLDSE